VGLMTWDLTRYDPTRGAAQQSVITNYGTFIHPHGEVKRSIVFTHEGATPQRMMINLSDTHISIANIQDMANPTLESEIEIAPYYNQIYRFGDYLVEQVQGKPSNGYYYPGKSQDLATFRVKRAGGELDGVAPLASFDVGGVYRVLKHEHSLVLFRQNQKVDPRTGVPSQPSTEAVVVDLRDPSKPRLAGKVTLSTLSVPYYLYWCGLGAYWGGFWFDNVASFAMTDRGFAFYVAEWRYENNQSSMVNRLIFLDVRDPDAPTVSEKQLPGSYEWGAFGMVADPVAPQGFYVSTRKKVGDVKGADGISYTQYKYFAQRWEPKADVWTAVADINTPGRLVRTWQSGAGERMFLSQDTNYRVVGDGMNRSWVYDYRLSLLRQVTVAGQPAAELLDGRVLTDLYPSALLVDGDKLFLNGRPQQNYFYGYYPGGGGPVPPSGVGVAVAGPASSASPAPLPSWETTSDRLMIFDLTANKLAVAYDQPTRMYNVQLMGAHQGKLFINLAGNGQYYSYGNTSYGGGDGILVVDVAKPAAPKGVHFLRTLGFATHIEFFDDDVYVASGFFGLSHFGLGASPDIPVN
jgi:hypothetical protein